MSDFQQGNYNLGTGDQFNAEEQHFEITRYEYYNLGSSGRTCPRAAKPPGCGGSLGPRLPVPVVLVALVWIGVGLGVYRDRFAALDERARQHRRQLEQVLADFERRQEQHRRSVTADEQRFRHEQNRYRTARNRFQAAQKRYRKEKRVWDHSWTCVDCGRSWHADRDLKDQR